MTQNSKNNAIATHTPYTSLHFPSYRGDMEYVCMDCGQTFPASDLLYSCPKCGGVFLLKDKKFDELKKTTGKQWQNIFDARLASKLPAICGIFRFYELMAPILDEQDIIWLGEGSTPIIEASPVYRDQIGIDFSFKNEGQNPSASFKDRGMACAFSYLKWLIRKKNLNSLLAICASTGDTSAAAALYGAYIGTPIKTVVLLPQGKVTPQQLSQPLGSGAIVLELPGVFDDCMKVVESLAETYPVALLNSKNSWRILGQESYAYETAQWYKWNVSNLCVFVPIGNAGNITAIMSGFLKLYKLNIIDRLPRIFGVQSEHANPVYNYYHEGEGKRIWQPVKVKPSVAQAAMIGNPVSFPRVKVLAEEYQLLAGNEAFNVLSVSEQEIMEATLEANRHGHISCTQGGECLAGLKKAISQKLIDPSETAVLDSTAHILKFSIFQDQYNANNLDAKFEITINPKSQNHPVILLEDINRENLPDKEFYDMAANTVSKRLGL